MKKITEVGMVCPKCGWTGTVADCEPDVDGDGSLGCPKCNAIVEPDDDYKLYVEYMDRKNKAMDEFQRKQADLRLSYRQAIERIESWYQEKQGKEKSDEL